MVEGPTDPSALQQTALVLGGGGITGIAWEVGLLTGLSEAGVDLTTAELVIGTSAGSVVGAQITAGAPMGELYERQLRAPTDERVAQISPRVLVGWAVAMLLARGDSEAFARRVGRLALRAAATGRTPTLEERLGVIASRLPAATWPERDLRLTTVDATSGAFRVLTKTSGVGLLTAVAASCAVPGVYPPVPIEGRPHIDGGIKSGANVDLAAGAARLVVLAPTPRGLGTMASAARQAAAWEPGRAAVLTPDRAALTAIGKNVLDPAARAASARAGRAQAESAVERVRAVWA